ncbi:MAG TPA: sodium:calcium symporter [Algoriphagus sp.]|jgi:SNF family Na+-dependent transporter|uniref:sodium:calcium symporter n=1 Tax=unclassified Algoriphagus TaxID=2641541 RepID=UPI000C503BB8|nr:MULTISPECIES: sodium:calcium symporter [unclassified Algoriphagus]MAL11943.1 sodium:calcium symporter [Algoriphagus sp.]HAH35686.1 sodium:calcium symporter [Algoriphagus sp.]HAS57771.1 sodium:calcium symporter [Algoriphagus sp.]HAZ24397.1 sodium:calcium symporter [Algoriphagus sp.]
MAKAIDSWGSRTGLILAMAGNAVGLGNFLRFPVQAVQNGGGAFIIPYLVCFFLMGIPLLFVEWSIGRFGGKSGNHSTPYILDSMSSKPIWKYIGVFGIFTNIAVVAYYTYIESWTFMYVIHTVIGSFTDLTKEQINDFFLLYVNLEGSDFGIPLLPLWIYLLVLGINVYILSTGLGGIEKVAKIGMPLLIAFGAILAFKGWTMGSNYASDAFPDANAWDGINFLWTPQYGSLLDPKVWMAAAGQIFFTLSVGMGSIQCYASYLKANEDIALNSVTAGFTNEFVEVVLGSAIVIPIAAGFLGLDWVLENAGFGMAFQTMPYLFQQWGELFGVLAGLCWFGLLFFAGITSSLAMGTPWMGFMQDEFGWSKVKGALSFGIMVMIMGIPTVLFYKYGYFDEFDYWAGTVSLVVFALLETILFVWVFGMDKGWKELTTGADIKIPTVYKFIMKFITPALLLIVFVGALFTPENNDWSTALQNLFSGNSWNLDPSSIISKLSHENLDIELQAHPENQAEIEKIKLFSNTARMQLVLLFLTIIGFVYVSHRKRLKK